MPLHGRTIRLKADGYETTENRRRVHVGRGRAPHVLYVAWGFPPCRNGGTYRALASANAFARDGWDVTVLTCEREVFERYTGVDTSLDALVDPRIRVERVPFAWPALESDVRQLVALQGHRPAPVDPDAPRPRHPAVPGADLRALAERDRAAAERIHAERPVDLCVATAQPARRLHRSPAPARGARRALRRGLPRRLVLRRLQRGRIHTASSRAGRWEERVLAGASEVWYVNDPIRARYAAEHPRQAAKMHVVANGYDPSSRPKGQGGGPRRRDGLTFGYIGTLTRQVPLGALVEGWREARRSFPLLRRSVVELHGYIGHNRPVPVVREAIQSGAHLGVRYLGPAPKAAVRSTYAGFDVLLLVLGSGAYVDLRQGLRVPRHGAADRVGARPRQRGVRRASRVSALVPGRIPRCRRRREGPGRGGAGRPHGGRRRARGVRALRPAVPPRRSAGSACPGPARPRPGLGLRVRRGRGGAARPGDAECRGR